jgi:hypothetical protein
LDSSLINENSSEEDPTSWVKIMENPVELEPSNETLKTLGGFIRGQRQVSFLIEIPKDAEPGEHILNIKPTPSTPSESIGSVGSRVVAITSFRVILDVVGDALRKGVILDVEAGSYSNNRLETNTYFQNTGTVTISASGSQRIYDKEGNLVDEIQLEKMFLKPKEIKVFKGFLSTEGLPLEDYSVYTVIDYNTGKAEKSSSIRLALPTSFAVNSGGFSPFLTVIILVCIVLASIVLYRKIR